MTEFGSRDPVGTDYSQLSHVALRLMAETQHAGNVKYGVGNWQKGLPVSQLLSHAIAHTLAIQNGDVSENHLGHALWNLEKAAHFIETRPDMVDIEPLRQALGLGGDKPADPNPSRNTNCYFCSSGLNGTQFKVIPPRNQYRQAHTGCFVSATKEQLEEFDTPPEGKGGK